MLDFSDEEKLLDSRSELLNSISPNLEGDRLIKKKKIRIKMIKLKKFIK